MFSPKRKHHAPQNLKWVCLRFFAPVMHQKHPIKWTFCVVTPKVTEHANWLCFCQTTAQNTGKLPSSKARMLMETDTQPKFDLTSSTPLQRSNCSTDKTTSCDWHWQAWSLRDVEAKHKKNRATQTSLTWGDPNHKQTANNHRTRGTPPSHAAKAAKASAKGGLKKTI